MNGEQTHDTAIKKLLDRVGQLIESTPSPSMTAAQVEIIALQTANFIQLLIRQHTEDAKMHLSRELSAAELSTEHIEKICTMASHLEAEVISDAAEALVMLRKHGFEVREFAATKLMPHDPRLQQAPNEWLFEQVEAGIISGNTIATDHVVMICEVRPKPDVIDDQCWIQMPYDKDPFQDELTHLHHDLDRYKPEKRIDAKSRAGFSFYELQERVLPVLSQKAGIQLKCMPTVYACILANDHPDISSGRSTEWRGDSISETHSLISGRSDRGPLRYVYYDVNSDPYPNRGFRLCVLLGSASPTSDHSSH